MIKPLQPRGVFGDMLILEPNERSVGEMENILWQDPLDKMAY